MQIVATDIMGPLPESESGNQYVLVASDYFTRWVEVYAIPNQEAVIVAKKLVDDFPHRNSFTPTKGDSLSQSSSSIFVTCYTFRRHVPLPIIPSVMA